MGGGEEEASTTARSLRKAVGRLEATHTLFLRSVYLQCSSCLLLLHPYTAQGPTSTTQRQGIALGLIDSSSPIHSALDDGVPWVDGAKGSTKNYSTHPQQLQFSLAYSAPSLSFALWTAFVCHGMSVGMRACTRRRGGIGTTGGMLVTWPLFLGSVDYLSPPCQLPPGVVSPSNHATFKAYCGRNFVPTLPSGPHTSPLGLLLQEPFSDFHAFASPSPFLQIQKKQRQQPG